MIEVTLVEQQQFNVEFSENSEYQVEIGTELIIVSDYEVYTGSYTVTPSSAVQTIYTSGKYVSKDINVEAIPYSEVGNDAGGITITIG